MFSNFKKYGCVPGGTPLAKVIGKEGMANIAAAATEPPAAATAGAASSIASKISAKVSAKVSSAAIVSFPQPTNTVKDFNSSDNHREN